MKKADKITQANGHFILNLDEPTIFLDVFCIEALGDFILLHIE